MRKVLAVLCLLAIGGCQVVKDASNDAVNTLAHPPQEILEFIKEAVQWLLAIAVNFFGDLGGPVFKFLGL